MIAWQNIDGRRWKNGRLKKRLRVKSTDSQTQQRRLQASGETPQQCPQGQALTIPAHMPNAATLPASTEPEAEAWTSAASVSRCLSVLRHGSQSQEDTVVSHGNQQPVVPDAECGGLAAELMTSGSLCNASVAKRNMPGCMPTQPASLLQVASVMDPHDGPLPDPKLTSIPKTSNKQRCKPAALGLRASKRQKRHTGFSETATSRTPSTADAALHALREMARTVSSPRAARAKQWKHIAPALLAMKEMFSSSSCHEAAHAQRCHDIPSALHTPKEVASHVDCNLAVVAQRFDDAAPAPALHAPTLAFDASISLPAATQCPDVASGSPVNNCPDAASTDLGFSGAEPAGERHQLLSTGHGSSREGSQLPTSASEGNTQRVPSVGVALCHAMLANETTNSEHLPCPKSQLPPETKARLVRPASRSRFAAMRSCSGDAGDLEQETPQQPHRPDYALDITCGWFSGRFIEAAALDPFPAVGHLDGSRAHQADNSNASYLQLATFDSSADEETELPEIAGLTKCAAPNLGQATAPSTHVRLHPASDEGNIVVQDAGQPSVSCCMPVPAPQTAKLQSGLTEASCQYRDPEQGLHVAADQASAEILELNSRQERKHCLQQAATNQQGPLACIPARTSEIQELTAAALDQQGLADEQSHTLQARALHAEAELQVNATQPEPHRQAAACLSSKEQVIADELQAAALVRCGKTRKASQRGPSALQHAEREKQEALDLAAADARRFAEVESNMAAKHAAILNELKMMSHDLEEARVNHRQADICLMAKEQELQAAARLQESLSGKHQAAEAASQEAMLENLTTMHNLQQLQVDSAGQLQAAQHEKLKISKLLDEAKRRHQQTAACFMAKEKDMQQLRQHMAAQQGLHAHALQALHSRLQSATACKEDALAQNLARLHDLQQLNLHTAAKLLVATRKQLLTSQALQTMESKHRQVTASLLAQEKKTSEGCSCVFK